MAYYKKVLRNTVSAINKCYEKNYNEVDVRRIRSCNSIPASDRSKIVFISRALEDLKECGYLKYLGRNSPKKYEILSEIDLKKVLEEIE